MAGYYKELTDVSDIVRFRQAGLCYYKCRFNPQYGWRSLTALVVPEVDIADNIRIGYKYAILVDDDDDDN